MLLASLVLGLASFSVVRVSPAGAGVSLNPADELETLVIKTERKAYYDRDSWGSYTEGLNLHDNCNTRCELLKRNQRADGTWYSDYDGFVSSNSSDFQVDHLVSVNEAHRSGGREWSAEKKNAFYNDQSNGELRLVSGVSNQAKSNRGPSTSSIRYWMPEFGHEVKCEFIRDWIHVKFFWKLNVDPDERAALVGHVAECGWAIGAGDAEPETFEEIFEMRSLHRGHSIVLRLYWAAFNRKPDVEGALFWIERYDSGQWATRRIAAYFAESPEFEGIYGSNLDNRSYVRVVYRNVLGRTPDSEGGAYWNGQLAQGMRREEMLLLISNDSEFTQRQALPSDAQADVGPKSVRRR